LVRLVQGQTLSIHQVGVSPRLFREAIRLSSTETGFGVARALA
jgi:hypothetical protein